jgi:hypothetical protein
MTRPGPRLPVVLAAAFALALALNALASGFFIDDAYISFHYADNLARDGSLYYNRGEQGPFGYTNPLYVFLLAALRRASAGALSYEALARALGVLALTAILATVLWVIAERSRRRGRGAVIADSGLAVLFLLLFPGMLPNFYSGLETGLFTLCLFAMILNVKAGTRRGEACFLAALAAALSLRMDGGFLVLPLLAVYAVHALRESNPRRLLRLGYSFLAAGAVYLLQIAVAGSWLPLSLYQKKSAFSLQAVGFYEAYLLLVTAPLIALTYRRIPRWLTGLALFYPLFVSLFYGFFMVWMFKRYVFPAAFALAAALLLSYFELDLGRRRRELVLLALYVLLAFPAGVLEGWSWVSGYRVAMLSTRRITDAMNAAELPAGYRTVAAQDAGFIAYRTDWRLLDLLGLTTPEILTEDVAGAVRRLSPTLLILNAPNGRRPEELTLGSRLGRPDSPLPAEYRFVKRLPFTNRYWWPELDYGYFLFVNRNANPKLVDGLASISVDVEKEIGWQRHGLRLLRRLAAAGR